MGTTAPSHDHSRRRSARILLVPRLRVGAALLLACLGLAGTPTVAGAWGTDTHLRLGEMAYRIIAGPDPTSPQHKLAAELNRYFGTRPSPYLGRNPSDSCDKDDGTTIAEGMFEEDFNYDVFPFGCDPWPHENRSLDHFWHPDAGYDAGLVIPDLPDGRSAIAVAEEHWSQAVLAYPTSPALAYWYLGRVAHLLEDMAQPAHVHNDMHILSENRWQFVDDWLEHYVDEQYSDFSWWEWVDTRHAPFGGPAGWYPLKPRYYLALSYTTGSHDYLSSDLDKVSFLFRLFVNLAETSDNFESEHQPGDVDAVENATSAATFDAEVGHASGKANLESQPDIDAEMFQHANILLPLAARYVAGLYVLFWDTVHPCGDRVGHGGGTSTELFFDAFRRNGWRDTVGCPINPIHSWGAGRIQDFEPRTVGGVDWGTGGKGALMLANNTAQAYWVHGAIWTTYEALGGALSRLGYPISDERDWNGQRRSDFVGGYISWNPASNMATAVIDADGAPTVSITSPVSGATVSGNFTVNASAADNVAVQRVEFYIDGALRLTTSQSPYSWSWNTTGVGNGSHVLVAKARDNAGNVGTSVPVTVTVSNGGDHTPPAISSLHATAGATSATITWTTSEPATGQVEYGTSPCPCSNASTFDATFVLSRSIGLTNLLPSTTYYYRAFSRDAAGNLGYSGTNSFTTSISGATGPRVALGQPNGGETWSANSVQTITWNASSNAGIALNLHYSTDGGSAWELIATGLPNTGSYAWFVPNRPSGSARVRVVAFDAYGVTAEDMSDGSFTIAASCPLPPAPSLGDISSTSAGYTVAWTAAGDTYVLEEDVSPAFAAPTRYFIDVTSRFFVANGTGTYYYRVKTVTSCGESAWSGVRAVTVVNDLGPGPITAVSPATGSTGQPRSVDLCWATNHPGGETVQFNVYVVGADTEFFFPNNVKSFGQTSTCYRAVDLPYNTRVSWGVEATDQTGQSRFSPMFHFTTVADTTSPTGSLLINGGAATTDTYSVILNLAASDVGSGVRYARFSNDGTHWGYWNYFASQVPWNLADYEVGGRPSLTTYTVYAQFRDSEGNESAVYTDTIQKVTGKAGNVVLNGRVYQTIQDAIDAARPGETVYLTEGVYVIRGDVNPPRFPSRVVGLVMKPGVTLMGAGAEKTKIVLEQIGLWTIVDADDAVIEGVTVINSDAGGVRYAILLESRGSRVRNCIVQGSFGGIQIQAVTTSVPPLNVEVSNTRIVNNSEGVRIFTSTSTAILNNTIAHNASYCGICTYADATIVNNVIAFNGVGLAVADASTVRSNLVFNAGGNYDGIPNQTGINGNIAADPLFVDPASGDYGLRSGSPAIDAGSTIGIPYAGAAPDMGALESGATGTVQVLSNRASATFTLIGPSATYTGSGVTWSQSNLPAGVYSILFAAIDGLYTPVYQARTLKAGQTLTFDGTYAQDLVPPSGSVTVNFGEYATASPIVTLTFDLIDEIAGLGSGAEMMFSNDGVIWSSAQPYSSIRKGWSLLEFGGNATAGTKTMFARVSDSAGNWTTLSASILFVPDRRILEVPDAYPTIQSAVDAAQPGDVIHVAPGAYTESVTLREGITVQGSGADQSVFQSFSSVTTAPNTSIEGFGGYLFVSVAAGPAMIANNVFRAFRGIEIDAGVSATVRNNRFDGNSIGVMVSSFADGTAVTIENNTFVNVSGIAAIYVQGARPTTKVVVRNNIIAFNAVGIQDANTSDTAHQHVFGSFNTFWSNGADFSGLYATWGPGDLRADPLFVDRSSSDWRLASGSPAIDSGHPEVRYNDSDGSRNDRGFQGGPGRNTPPLAAFLVSPAMGTIDTVFGLDAGSSADLESAAADLLVRWDLDGDGHFDTPFSSIRVASATFADPGTHTVAVEVKDPRGARGRTSKQITVAAVALAPPRGPSPGDGASGQPPTVSLSWISPEPSVTFDVYFGTTTNPPLVSVGQSAPSYPLGPLAEGTFYHWRVVVRDGRGNVATGPVWTFSTVADTTAPTATIVDGPSGVTGASSATFNWTGSDDFTATERLRFSSRLDPIDTMGSAFGTTTTRTYTGLAPGDYNFRVVVRDEAGNESTATRTFTVRIPQADLREISVTVPPASVLPGASFLATDTVRNDGDKASPASVTRYILATNASPGSTDRLLTGARNVPILSPGTESTGTIRVAVPLTIPLGTYFLLACADATNLVAEADETNNCIGASTTVRVVRPDLVTTAVANPPAAAAPGTTFSVTDTVRNRGDGAASRSTTRYYLSTDTARSTGDRLLTGTRAVLALGPGVESTGTLVVTVPTTMPLGTYHLLACSDDIKQVAETDETNNCQAAATTVRIGRPDLITDTVSDPPVSLAVGGSFTVTDTARNQGAAAAPASTTRYYLSLDGVRSTGDRLLTGSRSVPGVAPGGSSSGAARVTIPFTTPIGSYLLLACADDLRRAIEASDTNNCHASAMRVSVHQ